VKKSLGYELDDPGIESIQAQEFFLFLKSSRPALELTYAPIKWTADSFPKVKRPGCDVDHSPPSTAEVKNE
jgi:hypothetical protein